MVSFSQIVNQEPACNDQGDEKYTDCSRSLCRQVNLLPAPKEQACPSELSSRHGCRELVALDAAEREERDDDSADVIPNKSEEDLSGEAQDYFSDEAGWHLAPGVTLAFSLR